MSIIKSQNTLSKRQDAQVLWHVLRKEHPRGTLLPTHQHQTGQLVYAVSGVMCVETLSAKWTIPSQRALWIPPRHAHSIRILTPTELRTVYFHPVLLRRAVGFARRAQVHAITVLPLVRELVLGLCNGIADIETQGLMARLLLRTLRTADELPIDLPMPSDPRLYRAASLCLSAPDRRSSPGPSLTDMADAAAMSERTFSRRFTAEVGLSFRSWRQRARIVESLDLLATGRSTTFVAHALGFASVAAYAAAFRKLLRCAPGEFRPKSIP